MKGTRNLLIHNPPVLLETRKKLSNSCFQVVVDDKQALLGKHIRETKLTITYIVGFGDP
jgi:hypothetical protein